MSSQMQNVVIVGAGAMGCLFAARMERAGASVTLVDVDAKRLAAIRQQGLILRDDEGEQLFHPKACLAGEVSGKVDLLMLFTKGNYSAAAVKSVAHLADGKTVALTLQNGLGNAEILADGFGADRTLMGAAHVPADLELPNIVISQGYAGLHLGGVNTAAQAHADAAGALLRASGFDVVVDTQVETAIWVKLVFNAALNAMAMVAQVTNGDMNNEPGLRIAHAIIDESVAVAQARNIPLEANAIRDDVAKALAGHPAHKASMLQDREAGRATEIEFINGAIVREGQRLGVATPVTATLADLVRLIEATSRRQPA